jgi:hypothetical protein
MAEVRLDRIMQAGNYNIAPEAYDFPSRSLFLNDDFLSYFIHESHILMMIFFLTA